MSASYELTLAVERYDLDATLGCGQAFGWERDGQGWTGVVGGEWIRLIGMAGGIRIQTAKPLKDPAVLTDYLQTSVDIRAVIRTFPTADTHLRAAVKACRGLRLLRQDPWECLASFILSSTKQIVQIRQIVAALSERHGRPVEVPEGASPRYAFPTAAQISALSESDLRACKMGFRAPYLLQAARRVSSGEIDLQAIARMEMSAARAELMKLDGVGEKIADCVLLFGYGFPEAFPVDVWVRRVLVDFYFRGRDVKPERLRRFIATHFGVNAGYAQQYLFHHVRLMNGKGDAVAGD